MKHRWSSVAALVSLLALAPRSDAGQLYSINPLIKQRAQPLGNVAGYLKSKVRTLFPESALQKRYLFWMVVEASTDNLFMLGSASDPIMVKFKPGQQSVD